MVLSLVRHANNVSMHVGVLSWSRYIGFVKLLFENLVLGAMKHRFLLVNVSNKYYSGITF